MWSTLLSTSFPGPLWPGVVAPGRVLSMGQTVYICYIELFEIELFIIWFQVTNDNPQQTIVASSNYSSYK